MKAYPEYKDSGVEWIGEIPSHWDNSPIKRLFVFSKKIAGEEYQKYKVLSLTLKGIIYRDMDSLMGKFHSDMRTYQIVEPDSIVLCLFDMDVTPRLVGYSDKVGIITSAYKILEPLPKVCAKYYFYNFLVQNNNKYLISRGTGLRTTLTKDQLGALHILLPPIQEQQAIAKYLDTKTTQIDELISKKKKLIELLAEERTAIINQAVTKGIDPDVKMKDSGVEWIGDIPSHWEVKKLKYVFDSLNSIRVPLSSDERGVMLNKKFDYYGASGIIDKVENYLFDDELILIGEDGANLLTRNKRLAFIAKGKFWVNNHAHILKPKKGSINYLVELLELCDYTVNVTGSAQPKLTQDALLSLQIIFPPIEEQQAIVNYIETETIRIDKLTENYKKEIELLTDYKAALISEVVTGKVDVRGWDG